MGGGEFDLDRKGGGVAAQPLGADAETVEQAIRDFDTRFEPVAKAAE